MVVVKVGKPTERSKPGNRGKRDSQILLLRYLNRVHFDLAMSPLELEVYHQMRNVIGIDPAFYEYIFTVDADTVRHLMIFVTHMLIFFLLGVYRLLHRTLSIVWSLPVQTTRRLLAYVEKPSSRTKKAHGGL
jgi:hypothetical protein